MNNVHKIIEGLCNNENITREEQGLVKEYLKSGNDLIEHINKYNEEWKKSGIDPRELSGDGFAKDILVSEGAEKFIEGRSLTASEWEKQLAKIEAKLEKIKS